MSAVIYVFSLISLVYKDETVFSNSRKIWETKTIFYVEFKYILSVLFITKCFYVADSSMKNYTSTHCKDIFIITFDNFVHFDFGMSILDVSKYIDSMYIHNVFPFLMYLDTSFVVLREEIQVWVILYWCISWPCIDLVYQSIHQGTISLKNLLKPLMTFIKSSMYFFVL